MTCAPFVTQPGTVVDADATIAQAVRLLAVNGFTPLPVVDDGRMLTGVFGPRELATLLLPMGARLADQSFELGFVSEDPSRLRERLAAQSEAKVGPHASAVDAITADTSLDEALLRLHRGEAILFVVDDAGRLAGTVNAGALLASLVEGE